MDSLPDTDRFLSPISDADPCGKDLRYEGTYDAVRDARRADNPNLPQGVWEVDLKRAEWPVVTQLCDAALTTKTKDLNLAIWLAESWAHQRGFEGLARGLSLLCDLCETFWDGLYPKIGDDGDTEARLAPIEWMTTNFQPLVRLTPFTAPGNADASPMALNHLDDILRIENLAQKNAAAASKEAAGRPDRAQFEASISLTPDTVLTGQRDALDTCIDALDRLDGFLGDKVGRDAPSIRSLRDLLGRVHAILDRAIGERGLDAAEESEPEDMTEPGEETEDMSDTETPAAGAAAASGPIKSRADAYARLTDVADYLMRTEPHSPVPYLIRRAVMWGNMSFADVMAQLMKDGGDINRAFSLLGLDQMDKKD
ncbi:MAG: type VI secretion system protein TssA [Alphaproteobacteria bacterium]